MNEGARLAHPREFHRLTPGCADGFRRAGQTLYAIPINKRGAERP